jgi:hypothetical protein
MTDLTDKTVAGFLKRYLAEIEAGNAAIFAGAGLSAPAGYVDWRELLREIADELDLKVDLENDLISIAQFHLNTKKSRYRLNQAIIDKLSADNDPTPNHHILSRLPINTWWTTNYDHLIERALKEEGKVVDVKSDHLQLANTKARRDTVVYKMHGDVDRPNDAVVTRDDYEAYSQDRGPFVSALAGDLVSKTFLFLGFSFTDPNLEHVLSRVRLSLRNNAREHYAFFRKRKQTPTESPEEYAHGLARQKLVIDDLARYGVTAILVDEYEDIHTILAELERRYRRQSVFVSASADDFEPWGKPAVEQFMRGLGAALVDKGLRLATGLGLGVGNALLTGAIESVLKSRTGHIEDSLIIRPFPQHIPDEQTRQRVWAEYRRRTLSQVGVAIFLFGNKLSQGATVPADGMEKEWDIAGELNLVLIPVGGTGSMASSLAERALAEPNIYLSDLNHKQREIIESFNKNTDNLNDLIDPIVKLAVDLRLGHQ